MAAAVRMRRRSSRQRGFQAEIKRDAPLEDDNVFQPSPAKRVASPKITPSKVKVLEQQQQEQHATQDQEEELQGSDPLHQTCQQGESKQQEVPKKGKQQSQPRPKHEQQQQQPQDPKGNKEDQNDRERPRPLFKRKNSYVAAQASVSPIVSKITFMEISSLLCQNGTF